MEIDNIQKELLEAIEDGNLLKIREVLPLVDDVNFFNEEGETPLAVTALIWQEELGIKILSSLLDKGADIDLYKQPGFSALFNAVIANRPEMVEFLLRKGAKVNVNYMEEDMPEICSSVCLFAYDKMIELSVEKMKKKTLDKFKADEYQRSKQVIELLQLYEARMYYKDIKPELS